MPAAPKPAQPTGLLSMIESLESRQMLSASVDQGTLVIVGTHLKDNINLTIGQDTTDRITVKINGFVRQFTLSDIQQINIQAGQGNDVVTIDNGKAALNIPTRLYGSGGNDTLNGGLGKDRIYGGDGNDIITGGGARDIIYGEAGADSINGNDGNDVIGGGDANDTLIGGAGVDILNGDNGNDTFNSRDNQVDQLNGGNGVDSANVDGALDDLTSIENH